MRDRIRIAGAVLAITTMAMVAIALVGCAQQQATSSASASVAPASSASVSSTVPSASASSSGTEVVGTEGVVTIGLDYNAGTGYQWKCKMDPEGIVTLVSQETENQAKDQTMAGGPLRELFTFRAAKPGEVTLTFDLVREWEGEPAETQVYAFAVADDLKMVLNPYKSNFDNEPEWGSNS